MWLLWQNNTDGGILFMAWIKYKENCAVNSDRISDISIVSTKVYPKGNLEWAINFRDCEGYQFTIESFDSKEDCEQVFNYIVEAIGTKSYIDLAKGLPNLNEHTLMTEEYLLDKGFIKDFDETTSLTRFDSPNKKISVWFHPHRIQPPYNCYVHIVDYINNFREIRGSLEIAYVDEFESFLKLCKVDYEEK